MNSTDIQKNKPLYWPAKSTGPQA